jgi:hypothetical protein
MDVKALKNPILKLVLFESKVINELWVGKCGWPVNILKFNILRAGIDIPEKIGDKVDNQKHLNNDR